MARNGSFTPRTAACRLVALAALALGALLPGSARADVPSVLQASFDRADSYTDSSTLASAALEAVGARAMTMDGSIFMDEGFGATPEDFALYAHEHVHTVQAGGGANYRSSADAAEIERAVIERVRAIVCPEPCDSFPAGIETNQELDSMIADFLRDRAESTTCRSPCGLNLASLGVADISAGIASMYGGRTDGIHLAYLGPFSTSAQPRLLDAFSSWTERFEPEPDYSIRTSSGNGWHMLVSDQYVPGLVTTFDPRGRDQLPTTGARVIGDLFTGGSAQDAVLAAIADGRNLALLGASTLTRAGLLPLHVFVQWDPGVRDLDLHATGPLGAGRFHVYFASPGSLALEPNTFLHADCICEGGSEVITVNALNPGGVYRFSVFNFGNQSGTSSQLADSALTLQVISGGTVVDRTATDGSRGVQ